MTSDPVREQRRGWHRPLPEKLPKPSPHPAVVAFGACLAAWGLVTTWAICVIGLAVFAVGIGGWIREMLHEREE
jgi:hypothetical protein